MPYLAKDLNFGRVVPSLGISTTSDTVDSAVRMSSHSIIHEGWVLKKRRKRMQGFARRYFTLYQSGLLSYAFGPGQPIRDQIYLQNGAISTAPGRKDIHIDSNTAIFHIKCLCKEDYDAWMSAFRKFISIGIEAKKSATIRHASRQASISLNRSGVLLEDMSAGFNDLETAILALCLEINPPKNSTANKKSEKHPAKFGLFWKLQSHTSTNEDVETNPSIPETVQDVRAKFDTLKAHYSALVKVLQTPLHEPILSASYLPFTPEEDIREESLPMRSASVNRKSVRNSMATSTSESFVEWFDAEDDGPQEFVMDVGPEMSEPGSQLLPSDEDNSSVNTDIGQYERLTSPIPEEVVYPGQAQVVRRTQLPCLPPSDEGSLFAILKKNVGKDLSTITFPVTFNEPLTMLQRAAEEVEYYSLIDEAARAKDAISRIAYVAAFAISSYAHTRHRTGRKGFNPMLGETFEDVRMKFIAEKVRHHPLEIAYHAEGDGWELTATTSGRTKFWGKSLEIIPLGTNRLKIGKDVYVWKKPSSFMRNLMVGTKYFEHCGQLAIENIITRERCVVDFKQNGYWGPTNVVSGSIHDANDNVVGHLDGKWDDQICQILDTSGSHLRVLWKMTPFPKDAPECYGSTYYGITLNEITGDLVGQLPPTDSRYRPDVRALENGRLDLAEEEKLRVEQMQRTRRNNGQERQPRWFRQVGDDWDYVGGYWESRAKGWTKDAIAPLW